MSDSYSEATGRAFGWKAAQLLGVRLIFLVRTLALARILAPEDFGLLAIALIGVDFMTRITDFGMVPALVQTRQTSKRIFDVAWTVNVSRALVVSLVVFVGAPTIAQLFSEPNATNILRVIAFKPLLTELSSIGLAGLQRNLVLGPLTKLRLIDSLTNSVVSLGLAPFVGVWALVAGVMAGALVNLVGSYLVAPYRPHLRFESEVAGQLIRFGRWILIGNLVSILAAAVLRLAISKQLGTAALGVYFLASRLAFMPSAAVGELIQSVTFPLYSRLQGDLRSMRKALQSVVVMSYALLTPVTLILVALASSLAVDVLGPGWENTASLIRILAVVGLIGTLGESVVPVFNGLGRPRISVALEAAQSLMLVVLAWWLVGRVGILGAGLAWLLATIGSQILAVRYVRRCLDRPFQGIGRAMSLTFAVSMGAGLWAWSLTQVIPGLAGLIVAAVSAAILVLVLIVRGNRYFSIGLVEYITVAVPQIRAFLDRRKVSPR